MLEFPGLLTLSDKSTTAAIGTGIPCELFEVLFDRHHGGAADCGPEPFSADYSADYSATRRQGPDRPSRIAKDTSHDGLTVTVSRTSIVNEQAPAIGSEVAAMLPDSERRGHRTTGLSNPTTEPDQPRRQQRSWQRRFQGLLKGLWSPPS